MQTYEILVKNRAIRGNSPDMTLVRTSVGIDQLHILFDSDEWLGFPVTITFAQDEDIITQSLILSPVESDEWVAESTVVIPHEVIDMTGSIRVTIQGRDGNGNHIITAKGSPLSVEEAGDVFEGTPPSDAPSIDQWQQAYTQAMQAAGKASSVVSDIQSRISEIVSNAEISVPVATKDSFGTVKIGDGLSIEDGVLSATYDVSELSASQAMALVNLSRLVRYAFETTFDENGYVTDDIKLKNSVLVDTSPVMPIASNDSPGAVYPDNTTVTVDEDGMLHATTFGHSWDGTRLTIMSYTGTSSSDLVGPPMTISEVTASVDGEIGTPSVIVTVGGTDTEKTFDFAFSGLKGEKGDTGPSGYVLTQEDIETISDEILERYAIADGTRY